MSGDRAASKLWYKKWWGILIVICIWPYFLIWYAWVRSRWSKRIRIAVTAVCSLAALMSVGIVAASSSPQTASNTPSTISAANKASAHQPAPKITTAQVTETQPISFNTTTQNDSSLPKGQTKVIKAGQNGVSTLVYEVTYSNGQETNRKLLSQTTTTAPIDEVDAIGTYVAPLLDIRGSGIRQTQKFTASGDWTLTYTFDCSNFGMQGNFQVYIYNDDGSLSTDGGPNDLATNGGTTDYYYDAGTHYLEINSECAWHVTVNG
jgi:surface rod structure-forming protein G